MYALSHPCNPSQAKQGRGLLLKEEDLRDNVMYNYITAVTL